jgi:cytochrome P450
MCWSTMRRTTGWLRSGSLFFRPILRDGLLTAEGETWKRSRKAMAPVFTPRHARGFAEQMLASITPVQRPLCGRCQQFRHRDVRDIAVDMTELTFDILSATLFSGHVAGSEEEFAGDIERLLSTMGRVDPDGSAQGAALDTADPPDVRQEGARQVQEHRQADHG